MDDAPLTHAELEKALQSMQLGVSASDMHGSLVGYLCAGGSAGADRVLDALALESEDAHARDQAHRLLERLRGHALHQLKDSQLGFQPLLPSDEAPLDERADALVEWCRGFLGGFGLGGADVHKRLSGDGSEILRDFGAIAGSQLAVDEGEDDEAALAEVQEFVRVGAMLLYTEVHTDAGPASKTVH